MGFFKRTLGSFSVYNSRKDIIKRQFLIKTFVVFLSIGIIILIGKYALSYAKKGIQYMGSTTTKIVSNTIGNDMQTDMLGHINVLLVGYAGEHERGGFLTDTLLLVSFDPKLGAITFLSIPRDMYVIYEKGGKGKINGVYWSSYVIHDGDEEKAMSALVKKVEEITGIDIPYYVMINFDGFVKIIDALGGIEVDVKESIYDPYYPGPNNSYQIFSIDAGKQMLDGNTALQYARSRKTTSDFSRALRQQQIIEGIMHKLLSFDVLSNIKALYTKFQDTVDTNISFKNILGAMRYIDTINYFFSFVYTADCDPRYLELIKPGCIMYLGNPDDFGGASVVLPHGSSAKKIDYYKKTQDFAFRVIYNQDILIENAPISVYNGIDKKYAKSQGYNINGVAGSLALDLKVRAFNVVDLGNTDEIFTETVLYLPGYGWYPKTVDALRAFIPIDRIEVDESGKYGTGGIDIILGNKYLQQL